MGKGRGSLHKKLYKKHNTDIPMDEAKQQIERLIQIDMRINKNSYEMATDNVYAALAKNVVKTPTGVLIKNKKKGYNKPSKETLEWIKRNMK